MSLFFLFGTSNFLARFIPALTGSALILVPYLFRERIKPIPGLLLAFFLALDPGLISLSRQAGSLMPALTFVLLAWAFWWQNVRGRRVSLPGWPCFPGRPSGRGCWGWDWPGSYAARWRSPVQQRARRNSSGSMQHTGSRPEARKASRREDLKAALTFGGATILLGGTMFLLSPNGLSAWLNALPVYLSGWLRPSGVPVGRLLFALLAYQPLALLFGLTAVVRGWWQRRKRHYALEPVAAGSLTGGTVLPGPPGRRPGLGLDPVVGVGRPGTFKPYAHLPGRTPRSGRDGRTDSDPVIFLLVELCRHRARPAQPGKCSLRTRSRLAAMCCSKTFRLRVMCC